MNLEDVLATAQTNCYGLAAAFMNVISPWYETRQQAISYNEMADLLCNLPSSMAHALHFILETSIKEDPDNVFGHAFVMCYQPYDDSWQVIQSFQDHFGLCRGPRLSITQCKEFVKSLRNPTFSKGDWHIFRRLLQLPDEFSMTHRILTVDRISNPERVPIEFGGTINNLSRCFARDLFKSPNNKERKESSRCCAPITSASIPKRCRRKGQLIGTVFLCHTHIQFARNHGWKEQ